MTLELIVPTESRDRIYANTLPTLRMATTTPSLRVVFEDVENRVGPVALMQRGFEASTADIQAYLHDDVVVLERGWDERVLREFDDPSVGVVGFGGALGHGADDLYKSPYDLRQLGRIRYRSNTRDAETHGERTTTVQDVAVLDGFALIVRRDVLSKARHKTTPLAIALGYPQRQRGWPTENLIFHCYDYWLCAMAHQLGYRVRLVPVECVHYGGQTSTQSGYNEWLQAKYGKTDADVHRESHEWIYNEFRDVLPWRALSDGLSARSGVEGIP